MQLKSGTTLYNGRYEIKTCIGDGGFGITYLANDVRLDREIVIKEYFPDFMAVRDVSVSNTVRTIDTNHSEDLHTGIAKFMKEAKILARLNDIQAIADVYDFFEENNTAYIVMEYIRGKNLRQYIKERTAPYSFAEAMEILEPCMFALQKVHEAGIIHRDFAPDNIIIDNKGRAKIIDFGASRDFISSNATMTIMVKHGYAPVEQYSSGVKQGPYTDVYSLAAILYEMLTLTKPLPSIDRIIADNLPAVCALNNTIAQAQSSVVMKGLAVSAETRYQSVAEFSTELKYVENSVAPVQNGYQYANNGYQNADVMNQYQYQGYGQAAAQVPNANDGYQNADALQQYQYQGYSQETELLSGTNNVYQNVDAMQQYQYQGYGQATELASGDRGGYQNADSMQQYQYNNVWNNVNQKAGTALNVYPVKTSKSARVFSIIAAISYILYTLLTFYNVYNAYRESVIYGYGYSVSIEFLIYKIANILFIVLLFIGKKNFVLLIPAGLEMLVDIIDLVKYPNIHNAFYFVATATLLGLVLINVIPAMKRVARVTKYTFYIPAAIMATKFFVWFIENKMWNYIGQIGRTFLYYLFDTTAVLFLGLWLLAKQKEE